MKLTGSIEFFMTQFGKKIEAWAVEKKIFVADGPVQKLGNGNQTFCY